jgi:hypothetical protein
MSVTSTKTLSRSLLRIVAGCSILAAITLSIAVFNSDGTSALAAATNSGASNPTPFDKETIALPNRAHLSDQFLTVANRGFDVATFQARIFEPQGSKITVNASGMFCCDWCQTNYDRCIERGGDPDACDAQLCACMTGCGVCPLC